MTEPDPDNAGGGNNFVVFSSVIGGFFMENEKELSTFERMIKKYVFLLPSIFILIGFIFLLSTAPILKVIFEDSNENSWNVIYNFYELLGANQVHNWSIYVSLFLIVSGLVLSLLQPINKLLGTISFLITSLGAILLSLTGKIYAFNPIDNLDKASVEWGLIVALVMFVLAIFAQFIISYQKDKMMVSDIAEDGMLIAMAFVLNLIKLFPMPTGGSINLQMLPLFIIALRHGPIHGFISGGIVYGLLTCLTDGYGFATYPFDYLIGFGSIAVLGLFKSLIMKDKTDYNLFGELYLFIGGVSSMAVRFIGGTLSSMVIYEYDFASAALYNVGYIFVSGGLALAILMIVYGPFIKLNNRLNNRQRLN